MYEWDLPNAVPTRGDAPVHVTVLEAASEPLLPSASPFPMSLLLAPQFRRET